MKRLISIMVAGAVLTLMPLTRAEEATPAPLAVPTSRGELEQLIRSRAEELERVNKELLTTQESLRQTKDQRLSLQRELKTLERNIDQLELYMKSDEITSQKLGFEIDSLGYDIQDIEISVDEKREAIMHILREMQQKDRTSPLIMLLKNGSLADSVFEAQSLTNLRSQLALDIDNLRLLHGRLNDKVEEVASKKTLIEQRRQSLEVRKSLVQDQKEARNTILTQTKSKESVYEQQVSELKKQQDAIEDEIARVEEKLRSEFDTSVLPTERAGVFAWPIKMVDFGGPGRITQHYGERSYLYKGKPHNGLDIGIPIGTPVYAAADGVVMAVDNNDRSRWSKYQYGKYVLVRHTNDLATLYAHLSKQLVAPGQAVKRGELIGYSGSTGYATGPHLHFGAYWAPSIQMKSVPPAAGLVPVGVVLNPEDYLL